MAAPTETGRRPVVVVDDLHVEYRVLATGKRASSRDSRGGLLHRGRSTRTVHALRGVDLTIHEGDSVGVIGANGSGKSTLMRAIVGLTPATRGTVSAAGRPSMLGVGAALVKELSGSRNIILGGLALGFSREDIEARHDDIVAFAGLEEFIDLPMRTYSSGMTARLKFALATARDHDILIVDEALAVGDKAFRTKSERRIREIRDDAGTVFLVSHSMKSIRDTCSRTVWIERGRVVMDGPTDEVVDAYEAT
ncbi:ABC transporter ATP-binding protein [Aeromicrobium sp. Sec7.5]|uniref:ABC transporter ATP-binding protein n=1 Tax=Aeromicrobium sp. Sec7.5 TaxID=3121276 RepID=UPI002FE430BD